MNFSEWVHKQVVDQLLILSLFMANGLPDVVETPFSWRKFKIVLVLCQV